MGVKRDAKQSLHSEGRKLLACSNSPFYTSLAATFHFHYTNNNCGLTGHSIKQEHRIKLTRLSAMPKRVITKSSMDGRSVCWCVCVVCGKQTG